MPFAKFTPVLSVNVHYSFRRYGHFMSEILHTRDSFLILIVSLLIIQITASAVEPDKGRAVETSTTAPVTTTGAAAATTAAGGWTT